jgi:hypothetical protein
MRGPGPSIPPSREIPEEVGIDPLLTRTMNQDFFKETGRMSARSSGAVLQSQLNTLSRLGVVGDLTDG